MDFRQTFLGREELAGKVITFFTSQAIAPELFRSIQDLRKNDEFLASQVPNLQFLIEIGYLTVWDFLRFEIKYAQEVGIPTALVEMMLERMRSQGILVCDPLLKQRAYSVNDSLVQFLAQRDCLTNVVFGFPFIAQKYQDSVFKVVVQDDSSDHHIGTGFLISVPASHGNASVVITNEHVVAHAKTLRILRMSNELVQHRRIVKSQVSDLAAVELVELQKLPEFYLAEDAKVLDEVISIGYPNVAMARDSYQLTHRGEINSIIQDRNNETLILFSAKTGPGNSGGPLVNEMGLIAGVVCEDLFYKDALIEQGQLPYHAAIPSSAITKFLVEEYLPAN